MSAVNEVVYWLGFTGGLVLGALVTIALALGIVALFKYIKGL